MVRLWILIPAIEVRVLAGEVYAILCALRLFTLSLNELNNLAGSADNHTNPSSFVATLLNLPHKSGARFSSSIYNPDTTVIL